MRKFVIGIFVGIALLWLFIWNVVNEIYMSGGYGVDRNYAFVTTGQTMYTRMKDEEYVKGTYRIYPGETVGGDAVYKKVQSDIVVVDFAVEDMFWGAGALRRNDAAGCIISGELSYTLFGSRHTTGSVVTVFEKEYVIRSVIDSEESFMIVQAEQGHGGDWEFADSKIIDGMVLDISDENYRGEYAEEAAVHHGYGSSFYYASDYLDILPDINLPSKWSDFDFWSDASDELEAIHERRLYSDKDVLEIFYHRCGQQLNMYRQRSAISALLLSGWCVMVLVNIRKNSKKSA